MKRIVFISSLALVSALCLQNVSTAHGGSYRGPGDTVPGGGGGGGGGGAGPSTPSPTGPSTGGPSGPSTPAPSAPGGVPTGQPGGQPARPSTGGATQSGPDLTTWDFWWGFNKDQYLNLKAAIYNNVETDIEAEFLGTAPKKKNSLRPSESSIREKIVPALKLALEKERANDIVTGAMIALAKIGDAKNEEGVSEFEVMISKFLGDSQQEIAETAAVALGILANDGSLKTLEHLLRDDQEGRKLVGSTEVPYRTRAFAAYGLGLLGARTNNNQVRQDACAVLVEMLDKPDTSTRDVKVACVIALGLTPIAVESEGAASKSAQDSRQSQIRYLSKYFQDANNHHLIRAHAPTAMARLLTKDAKQVPSELKDEVTKLLIAALDKHSKEKDEVQQSCVLALGQLGDTDNDKLDTEVRERLKWVVEESNDGQARNFALISLAQVGGRQGAGEGNEQNVAKLRTFLGERMTRAKGSTTVRPWAGIAVGVMERAIADNPAGGLLPSTSQKEALRSALADATTPDEQGAFSIGTGIARDLDSKKVLIDKFGKASGAETRGYIAVALGLVGDREAIKPIQEVVKESKYQPELLKQAAIGLGLLGDKELVLDLCTMLAEAKGVSSQAAIASALGFIGDSRSIDPLVEMLRDEKDRLTDTARGFAAVALGIVADKEPLPWNSKISTNINYRANTPTLTGDSTGILDIL